jgi:hypothetical protein
LIANGKIKVKQCFEGIERLTPNSVILKDGREIAGDAIVLATGYAPLRDVVRKITGDEVANKATVGVGWNDHGELAGVCCQPRFSFVYLFANYACRCGLRSDVSLKHLV